MSLKTKVYIMYAQLILLFVLLAVELHYEVHVAAAIAVIVIIMNTYFLVKAHHALNELQDD